MTKTSIEWTEMTWNPVRGCDEISPGCRRCYAKAIANRFEGTKGSAYEFGFKLRLVPKKLADPLRWKEPKTIFVNSMSDLFHVDVPEDYIDRCIRVMEMANWHTYQILTKRSSRMAELLETRFRDAAALSHMWWGISVENRRHGLPRIDDLRQTPAAVRFLSIEPLLEDLGSIDLTGIHWVIVGGESGPGAKPVDAEWVRRIRDQCQEAGVKFFFKQWGGAKKKLAGRILDGREYNDMPQFVGKAPVTGTERKKLLAEVLGWFPSNEEKVSLTVGGKDLNQQDKPQEHRNAA